MQKKKKKKSVINIDNKFENQKQPFLQCIVSFIKLRIANEEKENISYCR